MRSRRGRRSVAALAAVGAAILLAGASGAPAAPTEAAHGQAASVADGFAFLPPFGASAAEGPVAEWLLPFLRAEVCVPDGSGCGKVVARTGEGDPLRRIRLVQRGTPAAFFLVRLTPRTRFPEGAALRLRILVGDAELAVRDLVVHGRGRLPDDPFVVRPRAALSFGFRILERPFWGSLPTLSADASAAPAGGVVSLAAAAPVADGGTASLLVGGEQASVLRGADGRFTAGVPLFLDAHLRSRPPAGPLDLLLFRDGVPVASAHGALRVTAPAAAPGAARQAVQDLAGIGSALQTVAGAVADGPGLQQQWLVSLSKALEELVDGGDPRSLAGALAAATPQQRSLVESWLQASGLRDFLARFDALLSRAADTLAGRPPAEARKALRRLGSAAPTALSDDALAARMQFYAVASLFGQQVIAETVQSWNTVGNVAGALGLALAAAGKKIPLVAVISAVLPVVDFAVNKLFLGLLPAKVRSLDLRVADTTLDHGQKTDAALTVTAVNDPPQIALQDVIGTIVNAFGIGGQSEIATVKEGVEQTVDYFLALLQGNFSAYAAQFPELGLKDLSQSVPALSWQAAVTDRRLVQRLSSNEGVVAGSPDEVNWEADLSRNGEASVFAHTSDVGPDLVPGLGYTGGAFGTSSTDSNRVTIHVGLQVTVSPGNARLAPGERRQFTATVDGASDQTVRWSALRGTIDASGSYTAPATTGADTITATSVADPGVSGTAAVDVAPTVAVAPAAVRLGPGGTVRFTAAVKGAADQRVTWTALHGTIDASGAYTAPATAGADTITARSIADPTASGTAAATVSSVTVAVSPATVALAPGATARFTATVVGAGDQTVTWSALRGTIDASGAYTARATAGADTITATSAAEPGASGTASVTVAAAGARTFAGHIDEVFADVGDCCSHHENATASFDVTLELRADGTISAAHASGHYQLTESEVWTAQSCPGAAITTSSTEDAEAAGIVPNASAGLGSIDLGPAGGELQIVLAGRTTGTEFNLFRCDAEPFEEDFGDARLSFRYVAILDDSGGLAAIDFAAHVHRTFDSGEQRDDDVTGRLTPQP